MRPTNIFFGFCVIFLAPNCLAHWDAAYFHNANDGFTSKKNWMASIRDDVKLSEMAMPGTHDSAAINGNIDVITAIVATQCIGFTQQLEVGIRVFDVRIRHINNAFELHHGSIYLNLNFDVFLRSVNSFLGSNPSETVLFRLKEEYTASGNTRTMRATLDVYLKTYNIRFLKTNDLNIRLSKARGKFIMLSDNSQFNDLGLSYGSLKIQDAYNLATNWDLYGKWEKVKAQLSTAASGSKDTFYMNYLSGSGGSFPYFVASGHVSEGTGASRLSTGLTTPGWKNSYPDFPRVNCFIGICTIAFEGTNILTRDRIPNVGGGRTVGIIMADFPGDSLIKVVIDNNKNLRK